MENQKKKFFKIVRVGRIRKSRNGDEFRVVIAKDIQNNKIIEYYIFKDAHPKIWELILDQKINNKLIEGEIKRITITPELIKSLNIEIGKYSFCYNDDLDILVWHINGLETLPELNRIAWSFKNQLYKYRNLE